MKKEQALERIYLVKSKRTEDYIQEVLNKIENNINQQEIFSYQDTMKFIQDQMSSKLGGIYIYIDKALEFLKNELKSEYKKSKSH